MLPFMEGIFLSLLHPLYLDSLAKIPFTHHTLSVAVSAWLAVDTVVAAEVEAFNPTDLPFFACCEAVGKGSLSGWKRVPLSALLRWVPFY